MYRTSGVTTSRAEGDITLSICVVLFPVWPGRVSHVNACECMCDGNPLLPPASGTPLSYKGKHEDKHAIKVLLVATKHRKRKNLQIQTAERKVFYFTRYFSLPLLVVNSDVVSSADALSRCLSDVL